MKQENKILKLREQYEAYYKKPLPADFDESALIALSNISNSKRLKSRFVVAFATFITLSLCSGFVCFAGIIYLCS